GGVLGPHRVRLRAVLQAAGRHTVGAGRPRHPAAGRRDAAHAGGRRRAGRAQTPRAVVTDGAGTADPLRAPLEAALGEQYRVQRLPPDDARRILRQLAEALEHAHRLGVVHRDIKPDNVLLDDESERALLADFGIAKAAGTGATLTEAGHIIGTPAFMAPEQA